MRKIAPLLSLLLLLFSIASNGSTITPVQPSANEPDLTEILDNVYGAGNYFRIDDSFDQIWPDGLISIRAISSYASAIQNLGYCIVCDGLDDVYFDQSVSGNGIFSIQLTVSGASSLFIGTPFTWFNDAVFPPYTGKVYSNPALNPAGVDHMVTFGVAGNPDLFVLAFEDWLFTSNPESDGDYQDLIFEVTYLSGPPLGPTAPEPGSVLSMAGGLAMLLWLRRRKETAA